MKSKYKQKQSNRQVASVSKTDAPVAGRAKKGQPDRKRLKRLLQRIHAWINPEYSKSPFALGKALGGCKCPGSYSK